MNKKHGLYMAFLTLSAIVLVVVLLAAPSREAQGVMLNAQPGFSLMTTGQPGGEEVLIVVDNSTSRMVMYQLSGTDLRVLASQDFNRMFQPAGPVGPGGRR
jgi:hypothetical protein